MNNTKFLSGFFQDILIVKLKQILKQLSQKKFCYWLIDWLCITREFKFLGIENQPGAGDWMDLLEQEKKILLRGRFLFFGEAPQILIRLV